MLDEFYINKTSPHFKWWAPGLNINLGSAIRWPGWQRFIRSPRWTKSTKSWKSNSSEWSLKRIIQQHLQRNHIDNIVNKVRQSKNIQKVQLLHFHHVFTRSIPVSAPSEYNPPWADFHSWRPTRPYQRACCTWQGQCSQVMATLVVRMHINI